MPRPRPLLRLVAALVLSLAAAGARAAQIVQLPVDAVLDARPVSTLTGGAVVPWTVGIDQDDGFMTAAAAASLHQTGPALPDDGTFTADAHHPEVVLHFSNAAPATKPQARSVTGAATFSFAVPPGTYETLFLFVTSSYGDSRLEVTFTYGDGTTTRTAFTMPDWGTGAALPAGPPTFFNLAGGLHKWTKQGAAVDTPTHALAGVALPPAGGKILTQVDVAKVSSAQTLTFWGATGVATSMVAADAGAHDAASMPADAVDSNGSHDASAARDASVDELARDAPTETIPAPPLDAGASAVPDAAPPPAHARGSSGGGCATAGPLTAGQPCAPLLAGLAAIAAAFARRGRRRH